MSAQLLQYAAKFIELNQEEEDYFLSLFKPRKYLRRQFIVQAGDVCNYESFVVSGCLRSYFIDPSGKVHIVQFAVDNWWISDMESLMTGTPARYNIDALQDSDVLQIDKHNFEELLRRYPKFERMFRLMLSNAFISHQRRIVDNLCLPAKDRYLHFLQKHRSIEQKVPQTQIASYLGMTPEFLSQIRNSLANNPES